MAKTARKPPIKKQEEPQAKHPDNSQADSKTNQAVEYAQKRPITNKNSPQSGQKRGGKKISAKGRHKQNIECCKSDDKKTKEPPRQNHA